MKNILITFTYTLTVLLAMNCKAQIPQDGDNILNNDINKFVGTWSWSSAGKSLQLVLKKENVKLPFGNNIYADRIIGFHKYTDSGNTIENSTQYSSETFSMQGNSTLYGSSENGNPNKLRGGMTHKSKNKSVNFEIEYIDATHIKLVNLENRAGMKINLPGQPSYDWSISLPQNIILTKQ